MKKDPKPFWTVPNFLAPTPFVNAKDTPAQKKRMMVPLFHHDPDFAPQFAENCPCCGSGNFGASAITEENVAIVHCGDCNHQWTQINPI